MPPFTIAALEPDFVIDLLYPVAIIESYHDFRIIYVIYELSELRRDIALGARSINKYPLSAVTELFVVPQIQHLETVNILSFTKEIERKRLINTRSKYTNYSVPIKVGLEHFTPAYWKSGALFRALAFHRSILSFLTRA